jgi:hypothetical protein
LAITVPSDPWHYPRPALAEKYLKIFDIGLLGCCSKMTHSVSGYVALSSAKLKQLRTALVVAFDIDDDPDGDILELT